VRRDLIPGVCPRLLGHTRAARFGERLESSGDVDAVAVDRSVPLLDDVDEMHADAELEPPLVESAPRELLLDRDRGTNRFDDAVEDGEDAVARRVDDAPLVLGDRSAEDAARRFERRE